MIYTGSWISYFSSKAQREGAINLAQGRPKYPPPKNLLIILKKLIKDKNLHQYAPGKGDFNLLKETLKIYKNYYDSLKEENILIVQGATEGLTLSFHFLKKKFKENFAIFSFEPFYESYPKLAKIFNIPLYSVEINPFDLKWDLNKVEKIIFKKNIKGIILASPGNPLGKVWKEEEINFLRNLMKKNNGYLIFDGVYENLYFDEKPFIPLKEGLKNLIFISSYSKTLSITGWRIGYIIAEKKEMDFISSIHDYTDLSAPYILQRAISEYLKEGNLEDFLKTLRKKLKKSYDFLEKEIDGEDLKLSKAEGGMFGWIKIKNDCLDFANKLFDKEKVAVVPGINFSKKAKNFIRINLSIPFEEFKEGIGRIKNFINEN